MFLLSSSSRVVVVVVVAVAVVACCAPLAHAQDPAASWLSYAKCAGNGERVDRAQALVTVPSTPRGVLGSDAFAIWLGIEPAPALDLIQPILKNAGGTYVIFNEHFDWHNGEDYQSPPHAVAPGDVVNMTIVYVAATNAYEMITSSGAHTARTTIPVRYNETFTDVYLVLEHQPLFCNQLPASGNVNFTSLEVVRNGARVAAPHWVAAQERPACQSQAHVISPTDVRITWSTHGVGGADADVRNVAAVRRRCSGDDSRRCVDVHHTGSPRAAAAAAAAAAADGAERVVV